MLIYEIILYDSCGSRVCDSLWFIDFIGMHEEKKVMQEGSTEPFLSVPALL